MATFEIRRGDIFIVDFSTSQGFEIKGKRPALVIQNDIMNPPIGKLKPDKML